MPVATMRWLVTKYLWPQSLTWVAAAALIYHVFSPALGRFASLGVIDVGLLWVRNVKMRDGASFHGVTISTTCTITTSNFAPIEDQ